MLYLRKTLKQLLSAVLCLVLLLNCGMGLTALAEEGDDDPVATVEALLNDIDSLQEMQAKRADYIVSAAYNADDPDNVAEHEAAQAGYADYVNDMFAKRAAAQEAYDALMDEQKAQIDPVLLAKLTDTLSTSFSDESYRLFPSNNEYNYQMIVRLLFFVFGVVITSSPCSL